MTATASQAYTGNRDGSARCSSGSFETSSHGPRQRSTPCSVMCEPSAQTSTPANTVGSDQPTRVPRNTTANTTTSVEQAGAEVARLLRQPADHARRVGGVRGRCPIAVTRVGVHRFARSIG